VIPANSFESGRNYNITVGATADGVNYGEAQIYVAVRQTPLDVVIDGGDRTANVNLDLTLTNEDTTDPDNPGTRDFTCGWSCEDWTDINVNNPLYSQSINEEEEAEIDDEDATRYNGYNYGICLNQNGGRLSLLSNDGISMTIPSGSMPVGKFYYFKTTCSKNGVENSGYQWIRSIESSG